MSQPKEYGPHEQDPLGVELSHRNQLIDLFRACERAPQDFMMGIEYEVFGQINNSSSPLPYEGPTSITSFFKHLVEISRDSHDPFSPIIEHGHYVGLTCKRAIIALEPGGQLEIAALPHHRLNDATTIFTDVVKELNNEAKRNGIDLFAMGLHPIASREDMAMVKKTRYNIMRNYMSGVNGLGLDMMTRSCAIQLNLDYVNEQDMAARARVAAALVPFYTLWCASSAYVDKKRATHAVERGHIWRETDKSRTGIPSIIFDNNFGYDAWIEMALDVPMYFIRRGKDYESVVGASFRSFMRDGMNGHRALVRDFADHLSTIFTEIRLKPILELRTPDSLPVPYVNALAAFTWAAFYDEKTYSFIKNFFSDATHSEVVAFHHEVIDHGGRAQWRGQNIFNVSEILFDKAASAFEKATPYEQQLMKPLLRVIEKQQTLADYIRTNYVDINPSNFPNLVKDFALFNEAL